MEDHVWESRGTTPFEAAAFEHQVVVLVRIELVVQQPQLVDASIHLDEKKVTHPIELVNLVPLTSDLELPDALLLLSFQDLNHVLEYETFDLATLQVGATYNNSVVHVVGEWEFYSRRQKFWEVVDLETNSKSNVEGATMVDL